MAKKNETESTEEGKFNKELASSVDTPVPTAPPPTGDGLNVSDIRACVTIIDIVTKQAKINGLIPKEPLVNFNQFNPPPIENFTFHIDRANIDHQNSFNQ